VADTPDGATYLLDIGVLIALVLPGHVHHARAHAWFEGVTAWATTPITEAGFLRVLLNPLVSGTALTFAEVRATLDGLRRWPGHRFADDDTSLADAVIDTSAITGFKQVTDFHLVNLAKSHGMVFATLDGRLAASLTDADRRHLRLV